MASLRSPHPTMIAKATNPTINSLPSGMRRNAESRSLPVREEKEIIYNRRAAKFFKDNAQVIVMQFTLQELQKKRVTMKTLEKECKRLQDVDAQVMSAIFVDREFVPILAYCANRPDTQEPRAPVRSPFIFMVLFS